MKNWTIRTKLLAGSAASFALAAFISYSGLRSADVFKDHFDETAERTLRKIVLSDTVRTATYEMVSAQRGIMMAGFAKDQAEFQTYRRAFDEQSAEIQKALDETRSMLKREDGKAAVAEIAAQLAEWRPHFDDVVQNAAAGHMAEADRIRKDVTMPIYNRMAAAALRLQGIQSEILTEDKAAVESQHSSNRGWSWVFLVLSAVVGVIVSLVARAVARDVQHASTQLAEGAEQVASAATQVSAASQSLAQGSSQQAASLEETSSSSEEINSMSHKNAQNSHDAAEVVTRSGQQFEEANQKLDELVVAMAEINSQSDKISKIIKVIDEIAFQTNILALNAAVEAARAGEAGMGFAVVADEVRNLAQRCAQAAKDTASLIEESVNKSDEGKVKVDQVAVVVRSIGEEAAKIKTLVDEVNLGSQEQSRGIEQIAKAIAQMEQVTQKNAANAEESASASEQLSSQAEMMKNIVGHLQEMSGGGTQTVNKKSARTQLAPPKTKAGSQPRSSLKALQAAVSVKKTPVSAQPVPAAAGRVDRSELPLDDDFKEF